MVGSIENEMESSLLQLFFVPSRCLQPYLFSSSVSRVAILLLVYISKLKALNPKPYFLGIRILRLGFYTLIFRNGLAGIHLPQGDGEAILHCLRGG